MKLSGKNIFLALSVIIGSAYGLLVAGSIGLCLGAVIGGVGIAYGAPWFKRFFLMRFQTQRLLENKKEEEVHRLPKEMSRDLQNLSSTSASDSELSDLERTVLPFNNAIARVPKSCSLGLFSFQRLLFTLPPSAKQFWRNKLVSENATTTLSQGLQEPLNDSPNLPSTSASDPLNLQLAICPHSDSTVQEAQNQRSEMALSLLSKISLPRSADQLWQSTQAVSLSAVSAVSQELHQIKVSSQWAVVTFLPRAWFFQLGRHLPIGGWLEHDKSVLGWNPLREAIWDKDLATVAAILETHPPMSLLYRFLRGPGWMCPALIEDVLVGSYKQEYRDILALLINAIPSSDLLSILDFRCALSAIEQEEVLPLILNALSEEDRYAFLAQPHPFWGNRPLVALSQKGAILRVLNACPPERLWDYLTHKNSLGRTALMEFLHLRSEKNSPTADPSLWGFTPADACWWINTLINAIPEAQRSAFLAYHDQGKKAMWLAQADIRWDVVNTLEKWGISRIVISLDEQQALARKWHALPLGHRARVRNSLYLDKGPIPKIITDRSTFFIPWESFPRAVKERALIDIQNLLLHWVNLPLEVRGKQLSRLQKYPQLIPQKVISFEIFQKTLRRWRAIEQSERNGLAVSETMDLESLEKQLPREIDKEEIGPKITAFQETFGVHPAEVLQVPEDQQTNFEAIKESHRQLTLRAHPDKNTDISATKRTQLILSAYKLYLEHVTQKEKALQETFEKDWRTTFGAPQYEIYTVNSLSTLFKEG